MSTHYDIIIIGTGPGGGTLPFKLAPSGKKILVLERGGYWKSIRNGWCNPLHQGLFGKRPWRQ